jgi:hypothetical protein
MNPTYTYDDHVLDISSVTPNTGPTAGGTPVQIVGRGFLDPAGGTTAPTPTVTIGGAAVSVSSAGDTFAQFVTPAHAAGAVDIVVTASDGVAVTLTNGFTYADAAPPHDLRFRSPSGGANSLARTENTPPQITQSLGQHDTAGFSTPQQPVGLEGVTWSAFGQVLFEGPITKTTARTDGREKLEVWDVEALGQSFLLSKRNATGSWHSVSATTILTTLLAQYAPGFQSSIEGGLPLITLEADGSQDLWSVLINACELAGAHVFVAGTTVHAFSLDSHYDPPGAVTDGNPDLLWPEIGQAVTYQLEYSQLINSVTVRGAEGIVATVEDAASIGQYGRLGGPLIDDNTLTTLDECTRRGQTILKQHAQPVPTAHYATRDLKTRAGKTVSISTSVPHISASYLISNVQIDQLENLAVGQRPRFIVTAVPAWAPAMMLSAPTTRVLEAAVDVIAEKNQQPRLAGDVTSDAGGRTTIPPASIPASKLAGCIDSTKLTPTPVVPGSYGGAFSRELEPAAQTFTPNHKIVAFSVDAAGRITAAAEDPVPAIKADGAEPFTANQSLGGHALTNAADPTNAQDVATKAYVDAHAGSGGGAGGDIRSDGTVPFAANESMGGHALVNVATPVNPTDAATKAYVDARTPQNASVKAYRGTVQTLTSGTETPIAMTATSYDSAGFWSSSQPTRLTVPAGFAGRYQVLGQIGLAPFTATGTVVIRIKVNGVLAATHGFNATALADAVQVDAQLNLAVNDYVELTTVVTDSAGSTHDTVGGATETYVSMILSVGGVGGTGGGTGGGSGTRYAGEIPTGTIDGTNRTYTAAHAYLDLEVYVNGLAQTPGIDYDPMTPTTFAFNLPPLPGDTVMISYGV